MKLTAIGRRRLPQCAVTMAVDAAEIEEAPVYCPIFHGIIELIGRRWTGAIPAVYRLTRMGEDLRPTFGELEGFAHRWVESVRTA